MCELRSLIHSALEVSSSGDQKSFNLFLPPLGRNRTIKQMATRVSLQRHYNDHILILAQLFEFCKKNINRIDFKFQKDTKPVCVMRKDYQAVSKSVPEPEIFTISFCSVTTRLTLKN